jgi:hypothetical protein
MPTQNPEKKYMRETGNQNGIIGYKNYFKEQIKLAITVIIFFYGQRGR